MSQIHSYAKVRVKDNHKSTVMGVAQLFQELFLFVNPNRVWLCRDRVDQLSYTTDFVIQSLVTRISIGIIKAM